MPQTLVTSIENLFNVNIIISNALQMMLNVTPKYN